MSRLDHLEDGWAAVRPLAKIRYLPALVALFFSAPIAGCAAPAPPQAPRGPAADDTPSGMVAFIMAGQCPTGWGAAPGTAGRLLLSVSDPRQAGVVSPNAPMANQAAPTHAHDYTVVLRLDDKHLASAKKCCNDEGARAGAYPIVGATDASVPNLDLPFIQLLVCQKGSPAPIARAPGDPPADPYPYMTIAHFAAGCPSGWVPYQEANGYFIVPTGPGAKLQATVGSPLANGQDVMHAHVMSGAIDLPEVSYVGVGGHGADHQVATKGVEAFAGTTGIAGSGIPYTQVLTCKKIVNPPANPSPIPPGVVIFFASEYCPSGWANTLTTAGRFMVGLPPGGVLGAAFGGSALRPEEVRTHNHAFHGSVSIPHVGVGLAAGSGASGYAAHGRYSFDGSTMPAPAGIPYIQLTQCTKQ